MTLALGFTGSRADTLASKGRALSEAAGELVRLHETSPDLTALAGVEVAALEARVILEGGAVDRVSRALSGSQSPSAQDVEALSRLEGVLTVAESRIGTCMGAMEARESSAPMEKLAGFIGLATGAVSLVRSII